MKSRCQCGEPPSKGFRRNPAWLLPAFRGLQVFFLAASPPSLPLSSCGLFLHEILFFFMRKLAVGFRSHPGIQEDLMLKLIYLIPAAMTPFFFFKKGHICSLQGYNVKIFWEAKIQPQSARLILFLNLISPHNWLIKA